MQKITTFLWFDTQAEDAAKFYTSIFPNAKITAVSRYGDAGPGPKGSVMTVNFQLEGQEFVAMNGGPMYPFTHAISLMVNCRTQEEVDRYWDRLVEGGKPVACGWLQDKYGLSWQITPTALMELLKDEDPQKTQRVMKAMMEMVKLDIGTLERAAASAS
jgi:predicted 3-demethylubiquinone-9 3-methyltransferase (glyoxalase superfamily)